MSRISNFWKKDFRETAFTGLGFGFLFQNIIEILGETLISHIRQLKPLYKLSEKNGYCIVVWAL